MKNEYMVDKSTINNSDTFKSYIYKKYAIISICIIILLNILNLIFNTIIPIIGKTKHKTK